MPRTEWSAWQHKQPQKKKVMRHSLPDSIPVPDIICNSGMENGNEAACTLQSLAYLSYLLSPSGHPSPPPPSLSPPSPPAPPPAPGRPLVDFSSAHKREVIERAARETKKRGQVERSIFMCHMIIT